MGAIIMLALFSSLLLASAIHPELNRLESLAVQHFGRTNAVLFVQMNRHLAETVTASNAVSSGDDGGITAMCDSPQLAQFCAATDAQMASANDGATDDGESTVCALKAMKGFYCNAVCTTSCKSFLAQGGGGEALTTSSSNDESSESDTTPSFMTNESELHNICSSSCLTDLLKSMASMMEGMASCGEADLSSSSNDDAQQLAAHDELAALSAGVPSGISDPTAALEEQLGKLCVRNDDNKYCVSEFSAFTAKYPDTPDNWTPTCESPEVKELISLGCCFGSLMSMAQSQSGQSQSQSQSQDSEALEEASYWVSKCGGSVVPCSAGALKDVAVVSSSLSLSADGLTEAALEAPAVIAAFKLQLASLLGAPDGSTVLVERVTISGTGGARVRGRGRGRGRRNLDAASSTAVVEYSVLVDADMAGTVQASIKSVDDTALTDALKGDAAFAGIPNISAHQSDTVRTEISEASPDGNSNAGSAVAPALTSMLVAIVAVAAALGSL